MIQRKHLKTVPTTDISLQLRDMTLADLAYCVDYLLGIFSDMAHVSLDADYDGNAYLTVSFPMTEAEWKQSGLVNRIYILEKKYIYQKHTIRFYDNHVREEGE